MTRFFDTGVTVLKRRYLDTPPPDVPSLTTRPGSHVSRNNTTLSSVLRFGTTNLQTVGTLVCSTQSAQELKWVGIPAGTYCKVDLTWFLANSAIMFAAQPVSINIGTLKTMYTRSAMIDTASPIFTPSQTVNTSRASWGAIITPVGGEIRLIIGDFANLYDASTTYGFDAWCLPLEPGMIT